MHNFPKRYGQQGISLVEVMVTVLILSIGLLGIAGLQARLQMSEMEAYQRAQALILLNDYASRFATNRNSAANYVTGSTAPLGAGMTCPTATTTRQQRDARDWCLALQGAGEAQGGTSVGAMVGGRGCVEALATGQYLITVAWQGLTPLTAPPAGAACGANSYNGATGSACVNDRCRRVVTTIVRVATL
jgi:type IV pilus assembly protein PilV